MYGIDNLESDVKMWRSGFSNNVDENISIPDMLESTYRVYPSVHKALQIILALPATSVEAERSFSDMRKVKTWLRSTMRSERLSDLCVIHCNKDAITEAMIIEVVRSMSSNSRRMNF